MSDTLENLLKRPGLWRAGGGAVDGAHAGRPSGILSGISTGYPKLDRRLPGGGWPRHALTEILLEQYGTGELKLVMPALARLGQGDDQDDDPHDDPRVEPGRTVEKSPGEKSNGGWIAWIAPPFEPYPPALLQWGVDLARMLIVRPRMRATERARVRTRERPRQDSRQDETLWAAEQALASGTCAAVLLWPRPFTRSIDHTASRRLQLAAARGRSQAFLFRPWSALLQPSAAALRLKLETGVHGTDVGILKSRGGRPTTVSHYDGNDAE